MIVLIVTVAAIILFIIQLTSLPSFDKSMILEIQNSFEVQVRTKRTESPPWRALDFVILIRFFKYEKFVDGTNGTLSILEKIHEN